MSAWLALDVDGDPEVAAVIEQVARRVHGKYERFTALADLTQEARIIAVTEHAEAIENADYGLLSYRLERDLMNHCDMAFRTARNDAEGQALRPDHSAISQRGSIVLNSEGEKSYIQTHVSYEQHIEEQDEDRIELTNEPQVPGGYNGEQIRLLLPAVWDESYCYGLPRRDDAPDADMPKSSGNKAHGNSHWAYIADIKTGWKCADLTLQERRAVVMSFGLGWRQSEIAKYEQVAQSVISDRINSAVEKIAARLNGAHTIEEEGSIV